MHPLRFASASSLAFATSLMLGMHMSAWAQQAAAPGVGLVLGLQPGNTPLGLAASPARRTACGVGSLGCELGDDALSLARPEGRTSLWGAQVGVLDAGRWVRPSWAGRGQGLNVSLFGRAPVWEGLGVYGKLGATYGRTQAMGNTGLTPLGASSSGFGLSAGAGLSYDFSPQLSAVFEFDLHDSRMAGGPQQPVRATSLGLRWRY